MEITAGMMTHKGFEFNPNLADYPRRKSQPPIVYSIQFLRIKCPNDSIDVSMIVLPSFKKCRCVESANSRK